MAEPSIDAGAGWSASLAAALIGAERAPAQPLLGPLEGLAATGDAGGDLLARIGAFGAYHLAGSGLGPEALAPIEPFAPLGPPVPPLAAARLVTLLGGSGSMAGMIEEWCAVAAEKGFRLPPELLPLLEDFKSTADQEAATHAIAGPEIAWLRRACSEASPEDPADAGPEAEDGDVTEAASPTVPGGTVWVEGSPVERRAAFLAFRETDPEAGRAALAAAFKSEKADMRERLVEALQVGLSEADEPFLEACLDDRAGGVRRAAQRLLPRLPGSRFMERMAARVAAALRIEETRQLLVVKKVTLVVTLPEEAPDLVRDGIEPSQYAWKKRGKKAQILEQVLARAPLRAFAGHPPRVWIEQGLKSEWSEPILDGLVAALWRERDPPWRDALIEALREAEAGKLSGVKPSGEIRDALARASALLPPAEWEAAMAAGLKSARLELTLAMMNYGPDTYSPGFSAAVFDWLAFRL